MGPNSSYSFTYPVKHLPSRTPLYSHFIANESHPAPTKPIPSSGPFIIDSTAHLNNRPYSSPLHLPHITINKSLCNSFPISSHILVVNPIAHPFGISHHELLKNPGLMHRYVPKTSHSTKQAICSWKYLANQWRDGSMPHITYSITGLSWLPSPRQGDSPQTGKIQASAAFFLQKRTEKSCSSLVAAQPQPSLTSPDGLPSSLPSQASTRLGPGPSLAVWLGLRHPHPSVATLSLLLGAHPTPGSESADHTVSPWLG